MPSSPEFLTIFLKAITFFLISYYFLSFSKFCIIILSIWRPKSSLVASKINWSQLLRFFLPCFKAMQKIILLQWYCCNVLIREYDPCANYYSKYKAQSCQMLNILHSNDTNELWIPTNLRALRTKFSCRHFLQWDSNSSNSSNLCTLLSQRLSTQRTFFTHSKCLIPGAGGILCFIRPYKSVNMNLLSSGIWQKSFWILFYHLMIWFLPA